MVVRCCLGRGTRVSLNRLLVAVVLLNVLAWPTLGFASASVSSDQTSAAPANYLEAHEYHFDNARIPGSGSVRQNVTAWQVSAGRWNGQSLNGLSIVLVESIAEDGRTPRQTNCYLSHFATGTQREALLSAFMSTQPEHFSSLQIQNMRVEPAAISIEIDGQSVTLHLGLIA